MKRAKPRQKLVGGLNLDELKKTMMKGIIIAGIQEALRPRPARELDLGLEWMRP